MRILRNLAFIQILSASMFLAACGGSSEPTNTANTNAAGARTPIASPSVAANNVNAAMPIASPTIQASEGVNAPCAVVAAHHTALVKRDEAALRKTLTQATIRQFEADARAEGDKTIVGYLTAYSSPDPRPPACGGSVQGDVATLQTKDAESGIVVMRAIKENGEWKLDLLSVKPQ